MPPALQEDTQRPLQVLEWSIPGLNVVQEPKFYDFNIVLDSGAADHVVDDPKRRDTRSLMEQGAEREAVLSQPMDNQSRTRER